MKINKNGYFTQVMHTLLLMQLNDIYERRNLPEYTVFVDYTVIFKNKSNTYMNKLVLKLLFCMLTFTTFSIHAESINEIAFKASIKASCSVNKVAYEKCFHINQEQCYKMLTELLPKCSKNKYIFPLKQSEAPKFSECLNIKFEEKLITRGIDLDALCSKYNKNITRHSS